MKITLTQFVWDFTRADNEYRMVSTSDLDFWATTSADGVAFEGTWHKGIPVANFSIRFTAGDRTIWKKTSKNGTIVEITQKDFQAMIAEENEGQVVWLHFNLLASVDEDEIMPPEDMGQKLELVTSQVANSKDVTSEKMNDSVYPQLLPVPKDSKLYERALL